MKKTSVLFGLFALIATIGLSTPAYADDSQVLIDEEMALQMGERFFDDVVAADDLEARDAVQLFDKTGDAIGFVVHGYEGDTQMAYVVFDKNESMGIAEFGFGEDAESPVQMTTTKSIVRTSLGRDVLYRLDYSNYATIDAASKSGYDCKGLRVSQDAMGLDSPSSDISRSSKPENWDDLMMDIATVYRNYNVADVNAISGAQAFSEATVEAETSRYACAVSAMLTVCSYYVNTGGLSSLASNYNELWSLSSTTIDHIAGGVTYGSTANGKMAPAVKDFCSKRGRTVGSNSILGDVFMPYKSTIDSGNIAISTGKCNGSGHAMTVVGYLRLTDKDSPTKHFDSLMIYDGWHTEQRILAYESTYYTDKFGVSFSS